MVMLDFNSWLGDFCGGCLTKNHYDVNFNREIVGGMIDILGMPVAYVDEKNQMVRYSPGCSITILVLYPRPA